MLSVVVLCLLATNVWASGPKLTKPNGDLDSTAVTNYILQLEQSLSDVKSATQTQEQKYGAVLSNVLSKLTTATDELDTLKTDHNATKSKIASVTTEQMAAKAELAGVLADLNVTKAELAVVKAELKSSQESLRQVAYSAERNISSCIRQIEHFNDSLNLADSRSSSVASDVANLKTGLSTSQSDITQLTSDLRNLESDVKKADNSLTSSLTTTLTEIHNTNSELKSLQTASMATQSTCQRLSAEQTNLKTQLTQIQHDVSVTRGTLHQFINSSNSGSQTNGNDVAFQVTAETYGAKGSLLRFDKVNYNTGDGYNKATGMFTAPVSGTYIFWANVMLNKLQGNNRGTNVFIYQNTLKMATGYIHPHGTRASIMSTVHLNKGETIHFGMGLDYQSIDDSGRSSYGGALLHVS